MRDPDRPWPAPAGSVLVERQWKYAPPPWVMYEAVVDEMERWLSPLDDEIRPEIAATRRPDRVLLRPWVEPSVLAVELRIEPNGAGSQITVTAYPGAASVGDDTPKRVRYRLGTIFGAALREWVDEPHW